MQIAVHIIAYDVNRYINSMLRNVAPWVDKIYIAYPKRPWDYIPASRNQRTNPMRLEDIDLQGLPCPVEIIEGDWKKEEDTRNACLSRARAEGFDWLITQDADEFYAAGEWQALKKILERSFHEQCFLTTWYTFWKSSEYVIVFRNGNIKGANAGFALRCRDDLNFVASRATSANRVLVADCPCYHYGYIKTDQEIFEKVTQWGHAHQFNGEKWYNIKWKNWTANTKNMGMIYPGDWRQAIRFPLHQPEFAHQFSYPVPEVDLTRMERVQDLVYDLRAGVRDVLRSAKRIIKS